MLSLPYPVGVPLICSYSHNILSCSVIGLSIMVFARSLSLTSAKRSYVSLLILLEPVDNLLPLSTRLCYFTASSTIDHAYSSVASNGIPVYFPLESLGPYPLSLSQGFIYFLISSRNGIFGYCGVFNPSLSYKRCGYFNAAIS